MSCSGKFPVQLGQLSGSGRAHWAWKHRPLSDNINILLLLDTLVGLQGKARGDDEDVTNDGPEGEAAQPGGKVDEPRVRTRMTACAILIKWREAPPFRTRIYTPDHVFCCSLLAGAALLQEARREPAAHPAAGRCAHRARWGPS